MKKVMTFIISSTLLLTLSLGITGCEEQAGEEPAGEGAGGEEVVEEVITAVSDANERGYVEAEVTFENGNIADVALTEYQDTGFAKGDDYDYENFQEAMEILPESFIEANDSDVDIVSGATSTSEKSIQAVERAIALNEGEEPPFDGTFLGFSEVDDRDGRNMAWVTVEDGEMVDVELKEWYDVHEEEIKDEDYDYDPWHGAAEEMPERFLEADAVEDVDAYTEATSSSEKWKEAVTNALNKAGVK